MHFAARCVNLRSQNSGAFFVWILPETFFWSRTKTATRLWSASFTPKAGKLKPAPLLVRARYAWGSCRNLSLFLDDPYVSELKRVAMSL